MRNSLKLPVLLAVAVALGLTFAACSRDDQPAETAAEPVETAPKATKTQMPPGPLPEIIVVNGKVMEVVAAGNFIFVLIDRGEEQTWATVPPADLQIGEVISLENATLFGKFYSKSLDRTFESLIFASGITGKVPKRMANSSSLDPGQRRSGRLLAGDGVPTGQEAK